MSPKDTSVSLSKLGRKGDPRMHRAVSARLSNPDMPLLDALRHGGFIFPITSGEQDASILDSDGVSLGQRKNQLSRRLRLAKKEADEGQENKGPYHALSNGVPVIDATGINTKGDSARRQLKRASYCDDDVDMSDDMVNTDRRAKYHPQFHTIFPPVRPHIDIAVPQIAGPSGSAVAVASLISTATSVGMTLEQLAMRLANAPDLFSVLSQTPNPENKVTLAVNLFKTDSRALIQKCMLHAGFDSADIVEGSPTYMKVALKTWEVEGKRLEGLLGCANDNDRPNRFCECLPGVREGGTFSGRADDDGCCNSDAKDNKSSDDEDCSGFGGRHVHRLSGKCGHKAIIHQPPGQPAHIDFVVDGQIECYEGIKPVGPKGQGAMWPSRFKCIDLACPTDPQKQNVVCGSDVGTDAAASGVAPKQLSLTDVDFDGNEWNVDFFCTDGQDDTLLGLIKLGDGDKREDVAAVSS